MISGSEWMQLQGNPQVNTLCVDPGMGHEGPFPFEKAIACMDQAVLTRDKPSAAKATGGGQNRTGKLTSHWTGACLPLSRR